MGSDGETTKFGSPDLSPTVELEEGDHEVDEANSTQIQADDDHLILDLSSALEIGGEEYDETTRIQIGAGDHQRVMDSSATLEIGGEVDEAISIQICAGDDDQPIAQQEEQLPRKHWSIFRVLDQQSDYSRPKIISIGPSYYKNPAFKAMETQKLNFLLRNGYRMPQLLAFKAEMKRLEKQARECYLEDFKDIRCDDFTWMMVLDGCFIAVLLRLSGKHYQGQIANDPIFATRTMPFNIAHDLLLLENQLPLFVLEKLFELTRREDSTYNSLTSLALQFFEPLRPGKDVVGNSAANSNSGINTAASENYPHLLALFHSTFYPENPLPSSDHPQARSNTTRDNTFSGRRLVPTATELKDAGVIFRRSSGNLTEFRRRRTGGDLVIPKFFLGKHTACIFRNLVAYEQHSISAMPLFSSLAIFYYNILRTKEDVEILKDSGIPKLDMMGWTEEVVSFFASVTKELVFDVDGSCLLLLINHIGEYCDAGVAVLHRVVRMLFRKGIVRYFLASGSAVFVYRLWPW